MKPSKQVSLSFPEDFIKKVDEYRYKNCIKSFSLAVRIIAEKGFEHIKADGE